jgi:ketopantoate reductase
VKKVEEACIATKPNYSSMLQDVLALRETEVDFINGAIVREGEKLGVATPVNQTITDLVRTIEKPMPFGRRDDSRIAQAGQRGSPPTRSST